MQSLKAGFFGGGGNITALAENGSYGRRYGRHRGHVTREVYITSRVAACLSLSFSSALDLCL